MEERPEQELKRKIKEMLETSTYDLPTREDCDLIWRKTANRCEEILSDPTISLLPKKICLMLRNYYLANKRKQTMHNILESLVYSPEFRAIVLHSDRDNTQDYIDYFDRVVNIANRCHERIQQLEAELKGFVNPSYRCPCDIDEDVFKKMTRNGFENTIFI